MGSMQRFISLLIFSSVSFCLLSQLHFQHPGSPGFFKGNLLLLPVSTTPSHTHWGPRDPHATSSVTSTYFCFPESFWNLSCMDSFPHVGFFTKKKNTKTTSFFYHLITFWKAEELSMWSESHLELEVFYIPNILWISISVKVLKEYIKMIFMSHISMNVRPGSYSCWSQTDKCELSSSFPYSPRTHSFSFGNLATSSSSSPPGQEKQKIQIHRGELRVVWFVFWGPLFTCTW